VDRPAWSATGDITVVDLGAIGRSHRIGRLEVIEHEAAIVRRIFEAYAGGESPRDIAATLNPESIPGPKSGLWNASTIAGSRKRANGILENSLYVGRIVWNRQSFIKDPETARQPPQSQVRMDDPRRRQSFASLTMIFSIGSGSAEPSAAAPSVNATKPRLLDLHVQVNWRLPV